MAANAPYGLAPAEKLGSCGLYYIAQSDTNTYAVGDVVRTLGGLSPNRLANGSGTQGLLTVTKCADGDLPRGVIVGVQTGPDTPNFLTIPSAKTQGYVIQVDDDPATLFAIQANNTAALDLSAGTFAGITVGDPSGSVSTTRLASSTIGTSPRMLRIREVINSDTRNASLLVSFAVHELGAASSLATVGTIALVAGTGLGALNAATVNAAIQNGGSFRITAPGTYELTQVRFFSNTSLEIGEGVTLIKAISFYDPMFVNEGALKVSPTRNTNIAIFGEGTIDGNFAAKNPAILTGVTGAVRGNAQFGIQGDISMIQVDNFTLDLRRIVNMGGFALQYQGDAARISVREVDTPRDFCHINGPSSDIEVADCAGWAGDDLIALNAWDWERSSVRAGTISNVRIKNIRYYGSNYGSFTGSLVRFLAGTRVTGFGQGLGNVRGVQVDGFFCDVALGTSATVGYGFQFPADYDPQQLQYAGVGTVSDVTIANGEITIPGSGYTALGVINIAGTADGQNNLTCQDITFRKVHFNCTSATGAQPVLFSNVYNTCLVKNFSLENCEWTPRPGISTDQTLVALRQKTPIESFAVRGLQINSSTSTGQIAPVAVPVYSGGNPTTVKVLEVSRITNAGMSTSPSGLLLINGGVVTKLIANDWFVKGAGPTSADRCGLVISQPTSQLTDATFTNCYFDSVKNIVCITDAAPNAAAINVLFRDTCIVNSTHPIILDYACAVNAVFDGCRIDTPNNLARVANAGAALTATYRNTTSTGVGASTITVASGTLRLRGTDQIAFAPAVVQTPGDGDLVRFSGTPAYAGVNVISGTGAGVYVYRGSGTVGWIKTN